MFYIKLDSNKQPVNHPMSGDNLKQVLEVGCIDDDVLIRFNYAKFEFSKTPDNSVVVSTEYFMDVDGIVRNCAIVREFTQNELTDKFIRARRSHLLAACDWTQAVDSPLSEQKRAEWSTYRQALRDLTTTYPTAQKADDVVWPTEPTKT
jgi:3-phenylpropionate/cinnamic acid dioxygenase small subunit